MSYEEERLEYEERIYGAGVGKGFLYGLFCGVWIGIVVTSIVLIAG